MCGIWAGDEDLGDGSLQVLFEGYKARCTFVKSIGSAGRSGLVQADVQRLLLELELTIGSCFSVYYRVMEHAGSLESKKEA